MDFSLTEEQSMLRQSIEQYLEKSYTFEERMAVVDSKVPFSQEKWSDFAELGWLSLLFPESVGGFDGQAIELMLLMQELGKFGVIEPYLATVVMGGMTLLEQNTLGNKEELLAGVMAGDIHMSLAFAEHDARFDLASVSCTAQKNQTGFIVNGEKIVVLNGKSADYLVVVTRTAGEKTDQEGITLFCIDAASPGVIKQGYKTIDGLHAADIRFDNVAVDKYLVIGEIGSGHQILSRTIERATFAVCAEAVGIMDAMLRKTVEYTKERQQFGVPLSSFQALQHRMVEMFMHVEQARSLLLKTAIALEKHDAGAIASANAALKFFIGKFGRKLGEEAVQLHGGMGVSYEMQVAHLFKRLSVIDTLFGNTDYQINRYVTEQNRHA